MINLALTTKMMIQNMKATVLFFICLLIDLFILILRYGYKHRTFGLETLAYYLRTFMESYGLQNRAETKKLFNDFYPRIINFFVKGNYNRFEDELRNFFIKILLQYNLTMDWNLLQGILDGYIRALFGRIVKQRFFAFTLKIDRLIYPVCHGILKLFCLFSTEDKFLPFLTHAHHILIALIVVLSIYLLIRKPKP